MMRLDQHQCLAYNRAVVGIIENFLRLSSVRMDAQSQSRASCQQRVVLPVVTRGLVRALRDLYEIAPGQLRPKVRLAAKAALESEPVQPWYE